MKIAQALVISAVVLIPTIAQANHPNGCSLMSITHLPNEHPLTKAHLRHIRVVKQLEVGAREGDVIFQFPYGRFVVKPFYPPIKEGITPDGVNPLTILQESFKARTNCFGPRKWDREPNVVGDWKEGTIQGGRPK